MKEKKEKKEEDMTVQGYYGMNSEESNKRIRKIVAMLVASERYTDVLDSLKNLTDEQRVAMWEFALAFQTYHEMQQGAHMLKQMKEMMERGSK
jgi:hypothetical protein